MNFDFSWIADPTYFGWLLEGTYTTLLLSGCGLVLTLLVGVCGAACLHFRVRGLEHLITVLVELARNTPSLVQLFFLYFMLSDMGLHLTDFHTGRHIPIFSGFTCGVLMLGFYNGAIAVDIIRSGLLSVPKQTIEGAASLGYTKWQTFMHVELPISLRLTMPLMANNVVMLIKTSSQASLVAVTELMYSATEIIAENFRSLEVMIVIWLIYLVIVSAAVFVMARVSHRIGIHGYGT